MVSFKVTPLERDIITVIVERAILEGLCDRGNALNLEMDVTAAHANGCHIDLAKLAVTPLANFGHDVVGISRHLNRETGKLMHCFLPRAAR